MKDDDDRVYYGWSDVANFNEAIIFYAEMFSRGLHHHEIVKMLDGYFPRIDYITLGKIRTKAFVWMRDLVSDIETKIYLAKSIVRLERICANPHEKTRDVLTADGQLTHLLGLANVQEQAGPEEMAVLIRAFNLAAKEASDGSGYAESRKTVKSTVRPIEDEEPPPPPEHPSQTKPIDELRPTDEEKEIDLNLKAMRLGRMRNDATVIDDEIKASNARHQRHNKQEADKSSEDLQNEIDLSVYLD